MSYDYLVIGAGPAGYVSAIRASQLGARVVLVEKECLGGTCLNRGCIPTKALVESATLLRRMREAEQYGLVVDGSVRADFTSVMARKDAIVARIVESVRGLLDAQGVQVLSGEARLVAPDRAMVRQADGSTSDISFRSALIATGSVAARPRLEGAELPGVLDSRQLLGLGEQPERLVVVGASVVGMEMASIFHNLGSRVTVLGRQTFLKSVDPQLARRYRSMAVRRGMSITIGVDFQRIEAVDGGLRIHYSTRGQELSVDADVILLAAGQTPVTGDLGLDDVGVEVDERGFVRVDSHLRTSIPGIYAAGDVVGGWMLAHVASHEGIVAAENALGLEREMDYRAVPNCVFTDPEIAGVGLSEAEAKAAGYSTAVARFPLSASGRALTMGEEEGLVRLVYDTETGRVLGVHMMGAHASELIGEGALAVKTGLGVSELADMMHQHPTLSECLMEAAMAAAYGEAIHFRRV